MRAGNVAGDAAEHFAERNPGIPAQAQVQIRTPRDAHVVLHKQAGHRATLRPVVASALDEAVDGAQQEIRVGVAAVGGAAEAEIARLPERIVDVGRISQQLAAERDLVHAVNPVSIIRKIVSGAVEFTLPARRMAEEIR